MLMPGSSEMDALREEILQDSRRADWAALWNRVITSPPILSIEAFHQIPDSGEPFVQHEGKQFGTVKDACREVALSDFEHLVRSPDEHIYFPNRLNAISLKTTADDKWIVAATNSELQILDPETFLPFDQFKFLDEADRATPPLRVALSPDGKIVAILSQASKSSFRLTNLSLDNFEVMSSLIINSATLPSLSFHPRRKVVVVIGITSSQDERYYDVPSSSTHQLPCTALLLDLDSGDHTLAKLAPCKPSDIAIDSGAKFIAAIETVLVGHCAITAEFEIKILDFKTGHFVTKLSLGADVILSLEFASNGEYLVVTQRFLLSVWSTETWLKVKEFHIPYSGNDPPFSRFAQSADQRSWALIAGAVMVIGIPGFELLANTHPNLLRNPYTDRDSSGDLQGLTICRGRLVILTEKVIHSIMISSGEPSAKESTELRKISCTPLNQLTFDQKDFVLRYANAQWLSSSQRRWVKALKSIIELTGDQND